MTTPAKFLFDECLSHRVMDRVGDLLIATGINVQFQHVVKLQHASTNDDIWIPQIADDGWVIVTGDRGMHKKGSKGEKFPIVCEKYGVNYAMFSRSWHDRPNSAKVSALMSIWHRMMEIHGEPRGTGFLIRPLTTKEHELRVTLARRDWILSESERFSAEVRRNRPQTLPGM